MGLFNTLIHHSARETQRARRQSLLIGTLILLLTFLLLYYLLYYSPRQEFDSQLQLHYAPINSNTDEALLKTSYKSNQTFPPESYIPIQQNAQHQELLALHLFTLTASSTNTLWETTLPVCQTPIQHCDVSTSLSEYTFLKEQFNQAFFEHQSLYQKMQFARKPLQYSDLSNIAPTWYDWPHTVRQKIILASSQISEQSNQHQSHTALKYEFDLSTHRLDNARDALIAFTQSDTFEKGLACYREINAMCFQGNKIPEPRLPDAQITVMVPVELEVPSETPSSIRSHDDVVVNFEDCLDTVDHDPTNPNSLNLAQAFDQPFLDQLRLFERKLDAIDKNNEQHIVIQVVGSHDPRSADRCTLYGHNGMLALARATRLHRRVKHLLNEQRLLSSQPDAQNKTRQLKLNRDIVIAPAQVVLRKCIEPDIGTRFSRCTDDPSNPHRYARVELLSSGYVRTPEQDPFEYEWLKALVPTP